MFLSILDYSGNILLAKVRVWYARGISDLDYGSMISCGSISELLKFLKGNSFYSEVLKELPESEDLIHRKDLEKLLKYRFLEVLSVVSKYEKILGGCLLEYVNFYMDYLFILERLQKIVEFNKSLKYSYNLFGKDFFCNNRRLSELSSAKTFSEFFSILSKTSYRYLFKDLNKSEVYIQNFVERKLYESLYTKLFEAFNKIKSQKLRSTCTKTFKTYLELNNFVMTVRYKRFTNTETDILPEFKNLKLKLGSKLRKINIESELFDALNNSSIYSSIKDISYSYLEQLPEKYLYIKCKDNMSFSSSVPLVIISFIHLLKIKINNIIKIIEGLRCGLPQNKIEELLVA